MKPDIKVTAEKVVNYFANNALRVKARLRRHINMFLIFVIVFVDLLGFGIIIPLLPFYAEHFQANPDTVGMLMATYSLTQFIATPLWGRLSDYYGRRPILLISLAGTALSYILLAHANTLLLLFVARAVGGFVAGNISAAFAYISDITTPANRAKGMGLIGAAFGLGFIFGPAIGGILAGPDVTNADFRTPSLVAAVLSALAFLIGLVWLKESHTKKVREQLNSLSHKARRKILIKTLKQPTLFTYLLLLFLSTFVFAGMEATFAMWSERQFDWGPSHNGYLFAGVGLFSAFLQGGVTGRLTKIFGETKLIIIGLLTLASGLFLLPQAQNMILLAISMTLLTFGFSLLQPSLNSLISFSAHADNQGGIMGFSRSVSTLARVVGSTWAGFLFATWGREWPYLIGGGIIVIALLFTWRILKTTSSQLTTSLKVSHMD